MGHSPGNEEPQAREDDQPQPRRNKSNKPLRVRILVLPAKGSPGSGQLNEYLLAYNALYRKKGRGARFVMVQGRGSTATNSLLLAMQCPKCPYRPVSSHKNGMYKVLCSADGLMHCKCYTCRSVQVFRVSRVEVRVDRRRSTVTEAFGLEKVFA